MQRIKHLLSKNDHIDYFVKLVWVNIRKGIYYLKYRSMRVNEKQILFECFQGKFINDSPLAIYQKFLDLESDIEPVWVIRHPDQKAILSGSNKHIKIKFVEYGSSEYFGAYATSSHWIVNCRTPLNIVKRKGQRLIQCWHGTPLKKMGHDIVKGNNAKTSLKGLKLAYSIEASKVDYFISPSKYASDCFCSSFNMSREKVLEVGYPRNDELVNSKRQSDRIANLKKKLGIDVGKKVILYAPTWRDNQYSQKQRSHTLSNPLDSKEFTDALSDFVFIYRGHYFTRPEREMENFLDYTDYNNLNELLLVSDILITDYSSIFFDFLILDRRVIFYMPDLDEYSNESRGFYLDVEGNLPGLVTKSISELLDAITFIRANQSAVYRSTFSPNEDGNASLRVIERLDFTKVK